MEKAAEKTPREEGRNTEPTVDPGADAAEKTLREQGRTRLPHVGAYEASKTPWEDLSNKLANEYGTTIATLSPETSQSIAATGGTTAGNAESLLGVSGSSGLGAWMDQMTAGASKEGAGVANAQAAQLKAEEGGEAGIKSAIQGLGKADDQQAAAAPYQQLLQALAAEVPYHLASGALQPSTTGNPLFGSPIVTQAETAIGLTGVPGSTSGGPTLGLPGAPGAPTTTTQLPAVTTTPTGGADPTTQAFLAQLQTPGNPATP